MTLKASLTKSKFNSLATHPLQSWEWGEFRRAWGNEVVRFPFGQLTLHNVPFLPYKIGTFEKGPKPTSQMLKNLKEFAKEKNLIFIKLEPNVLKEKKLETLFRNFGAVPGKTLFTPTSFWIDLTKSEEELMASFHPKTRYNIRVAQRRGASVVEDNSDKAFEKYIELTRETVTRQGFYAHTEKYHRLMWEYLKPAGIAHLLTARYKGEIITTWILFAWKNFLYYPYGASTDKYREVMANNLMMWEAIKLGKRLGLTTFELWGREVGKGFTKFKEGYNPKVVEFIGTWDLVTSPLYYPYRIAEVIRWALLRPLGKLGLSKYRF